MLDIREDILNNNYYRRIQELKRKRSVEKDNTMFATTETIRK